MTLEELRNEFRAVRENRRMVDELRSKAEELRQSAMASAIRYDKDRIQTTPENYQERVLVDAADLDKTADRLIIEEDSRKLRLLDMINTLDSMEEQVVLIAHYFNNKSFRDMEDDKPFGHVTLWRRKEDALENIIKKM